MPPNSFLTEFSEKVSVTHDTDQKNATYKNEIVWRNVLIFIYLHVAAIYGLYHVLTGLRLATFIWLMFTFMISSHGVTAGAHRLWTHRTYKANLPLRIYLAIGFTTCLQNHIYEWSRDHRLHHKYVDTDADPHNINRGFFFAHMGWLLVRKHPQVKIKGKTIDLSDLEADPVVRFQRRHYPILALLCCFLIPAVVPWCFWNESFALAWNIAVWRYVMVLHITWSVNSFAHACGTRPYDVNAKATENKIVSFFGGGEGFHNYHHTFAWDYKVAELGTYWGNTSTAFIDLMAMLGWAWDLKTASPELVKMTILRQGAEWKKMEVAGASRRQG